MLTHTDILPLPASRELDALVAEQVMGCANIVRGSYFPYCRCSPALHNGEDGYLESYSTSIAAAWEVVEKVHLSLVRCEEGWLACPFPDSAIAVWPGWCAIDHEFHVINGKDHYAVADTAPLAICRAALKVVGAIHGT
jgi:hypothetical protein